MGKQTSASMKMGHPTVSHCDLRIVVPFVMKTQANRAGNYSQSIITLMLQYNVVTRFALPKLVILITWFSKITEIANK